MRYWVFHEEQLSAALAMFEAERTTAGASEQQARDDTVTIATFLNSKSAFAARLIGGGRPIDTGKG